jgi:hypothetical protein
MRARSHKTFIMRVLRGQRARRKPVKCERSLRYVTTMLCQIRVTLAVTDAVLTIRRITVPLPLNAIPRATRLAYIAQIAGLLGG